MAMPAAKPDYGIDAPSVVLTFFGLGFAATFAGIFIGSAAGVMAAAAPWLIAAVCLGTALAMIRSSRSGKARVWALLLDELALRGDEDTLDVGCGRGLVLIETARRLQTGHAVGIDVWRSKDQSGNDPGATEHNLLLAGVAERAEVRDADMTDLPFADASFDLVTASLAIHNIADRARREAALREVARVLRPGGRAVIVDIAHTDEYSAVFDSLRMSDVTRSKMTFSIYPPARIVTATARNGDDRRAG